MAEESGTVPRSRAATAGAGPAHHAEQNVDGGGGGGGGGGGWGRRWGAGVSTRLRTSCVGRGARSTFADNGPRSVPRRSCPLAGHVHVEAYEVPDRIAEAVALRDLACVFPWCTRPARRLRADAARLRLRPRDPPRQGRGDLHLPARPAVPSTPPAQDPRRLDLHHPRTRQLPLVEPRTAISTCATTPAPSTSPTTDAHSPRRPTSSHPAPVPALTHHRAGREATPGIDTGGA